MSKEVRRIHPRVSYEQRIRLLGEDGQPVIVGRTMNLSPSGIYVRAPNGCDVGSEVTCDLPLPGGTRQLRGRVTRTQPLSDDSTGIGIQFVDLSTGDSSSLHRALEGTGPRPVGVKVLFEGMTKPIKCQGVVTADGIRLSTSLPFLRLGSDVKAIYGGKDSAVDARGVLTGVHLEPVSGDGVPRLGIEVDINSETPHLPSKAPEAQRTDATAGGVFTTWDKPPATRGAEPSVVTEPAPEAAATSGWRNLLGRLESLRAWGFVAVAAVTFSMVYFALNHVMVPAPPPPPPALGEPRGVPAPRQQPLIVRAAVNSAPSVETAPAEAKAVAAPPPEAAAPVPAKVRRALTARPRPAVSPFLFDDASGRYALRPGASIDMKGERIVGLGGLTASDDSAGNLRGIDVAVESGALFVEIALPHPETDGHFGVQVTPSWQTALAIVGKTTAGFTVSFGTPAPAEAHLDWLLVR
ncbi:MAG TPA: PilZ domain-containing protein [Polyangia bacterium]|jgi:hypothetical protein